MYKTLWLMVIKVGDKWCKATTTWKFWWNFLAKSLIFSRYPSFSPFERPDAYKCYIFSESYGSRETREIKISTSKFDLEARGILSSLWTQTGPWSDTASYATVSVQCLIMLILEVWGFPLWLTPIIHYTATLPPTLLPKLASLDLPSSLCVTHPSRLSGISPAT